MPHKQSRYERKIARDAEMKPRGLRRAKVYLHSHLCTCTKKWLCREAQEICGAKEQDCVQCSEKKRAIEAENNSGEQLHIDFDEPRTYAAYTDFISYSELAKTFKLVESVQVLTKAEMKKAVSDLKGGWMPYKLDYKIYPGKLFYPGGSKLYDVQITAYSDVKMMSAEEITEEITEDAPDSGNGKYPDAVYLHKSSTPYYVYPEGGILW